MRHRKHLTESYAKQVLHMQKAFEQMNIKLHNMLTDITGKSGKAIVEAILAEERDASQLAQLVDHRVRSSQEQIVKWKPIDKRNLSLHSSKLTNSIYVTKRRLLNAM